MTGDPHPEEDRSLIVAKAPDGLRGLTAEMDEIDGRMAVKLLV
jgi:hypothetical protein